MYPFIINKIILLSDLECDFLNTKQGCKKLNQVKSSVVRFDNLFWINSGFCQKWLPRL